MSGESTVVFTCNWGGLSCIEAAAQKDLTYPATVKVVRVGCLARAHAGLLLKAFELGAQSVMLLGCAAGECRSEHGDRLVEQTCEKARGVMRLLGISPHRLKLVRLDPGDGEGFVKQVNEFNETNQRS